MTKQKLLAALLAAMFLVLTACGNSAAQPDSSAAQPSAAPEADTLEDTLPPEAAEPPSEETEPHDVADASIAESNILIVYFSRVGITPFDDDVDAVSSASTNIRDGELVGNVQYLAEFIAEETGGDLFQIITEKEYPTDYRDTTDLAKEEQNNNERPALASHVEDMDQYDVVFLGYPNWLAYHNLIQCTQG